MKIQLLGAIAASKVPVRAFQCGINAVSAANTKTSHMISP